MRRWHPIAWIVGIIVVVLVVLFFLVPPLLPTRWGTQIIARSFSKQIPGRIEIVDLEIQWMGPQIAKGITVFDPSDRATITVDQITVTTSLWALLWGSTDLGTVTIQRPQVSIVYDKSGRSSVRRALGIVANGNQSSVLAAGMSRARDVANDFYSGTYIIEQGVVRTDAPELAAVTFSDVQLRLALPRTRKNIAFSCSARTGEGRLQLSAENIRLTPSGIPLPAKGFSIRGVAHNIPVAGLDAISAVVYPSMLGLLNELLATPLNGTITEEKGHLVLHAHTPHLTLGLEGQISNHSFSLLKPASLSLLMTPAASTRLFYLFPRVHDLRLRATTHLTLTVPELSAELNGEIQNLTGNAEIKLDEAHLDHSLSGPFVLNTFLLRGDARGRGKTATMSGEIALTRQKTEGRVVASAITHNFLTNQATTNFDLSADRFPTTLVEPFMHRGDLISALLGSHLSLNVSGLSKLSSTEITVSAQSETLALAPMHVQLAETISLLEPTHISYTVRQRAWDAVWGEHFPIKLREPAEAGVVLKTFQMPNSQPVVPSHVQLVGSFAMPQVDLTGVPDQGNVTLNDLHLRLIGDTVANAHFEAAAELFFPDEAGFWHRAIGDTLPATLQAEVVATPAWKINLPRILLWVQSRLLSIQAEASLHNFRHLEMLSPLQIHYTLTSNLIPTIKKPADLDLELEPWTLNLSETNWWRTRFVGQATVDTMTFSGPLHPHIEALKGDFVINDPQNTARANFSGNTTTVVSKEAGAIQGTVSLDHFLTESGGNLRSGHLKSEITVENLPTGALGLILHQPHLDTLIGSLTSLLVRTNLGPICPAVGEISLTAQSDHMRASGDFRLADTASLADPRKPARLKWTLTPEAFDALGPQPGLKLTAPATFTAALTKLRWPRDESGCCAEFDLKAHLSDAALAADGGKDTAQLRDVALNLHAEGSDKPADLRATGKLNDGQMALIATIGNFLGPRAVQTATIDAQARLEDVSVPWLLRLLPSAGPLQRTLALALGEQISARATAKLAAWEGPLSLSLKTDHAMATIEAAIRHGALILTQAVAGSLEITPQLGSVILQAFNPLLISSMRSDKWATVSIEPDGFMLPLAPLDLAGLTIRKGEIDLGKMWIARQGTVARLLNLFPKAHAASQNEIRAWATPAYFSANAGDITIDRWDLLIDRSLQVASWGNVNLARNSVRLMLAVPGYSLRKVLSNDAIPTEEFLIIPVRGTVLETKIDWNRAAGGLAALIARTQGSTTGAATGLALDIITGAARDKAKVPPPTTQPFPWADDFTWPTYQKKPS